MQYAKYPLDDHFAADLKTHFDAFLEFMAKAQGIPGSRVLVHCQQGMRYYPNMCCIVTRSRSTSFVLLFLLKSGKTLKDVS